MWNYAQPSGKCRAKPECYILPCMISIFYWRLRYQIHLFCHTFIMLSKTRSILVQIVVWQTVVQSSTFWGSHSADAVESQLLRHHLHERGLLLANIFRYLACDNRDGCSCCNISFYFSYFKNTSRLKQYRLSEQLCSTGQKGQNGT